MRREKTRGQISLIPSQSKAVKAKSDEGLKGDLMISSQCRAARAILNWSQTELAIASGVSMSTVSDFEIDKREPRPDILTAIRHALQGAGVEFLPAKDGKGAGVRLREG